MKRTIVLEQVIRRRHEIIVEYENEEDLEAAIENMNENNTYVWDCAGDIGSIPGIDILNVDENCDEDEEFIEYYDDYDVKG